MTIASNVTKELERLVPILSSDLLGRKGDCVCSTCGGPKSHGAGKQCRKCYREKSKLRAAAVEQEKIKLYQLRDQKHQELLERSLFDGYRFVSLDAEGAHDERTLLSKLQSPGLSPDEELMFKEEREMENKYENRGWRIEEYNRWLERKKSSFYEAPNGCKP